MAKILAIRKATVTIIQKQLAEVINESDSFIAVTAINREISPPSQIENFIVDIKMLAQVIKNIRFVYFIGWPMSKLV